MGDTIVGRSAEFPPKEVAKALGPGASRKHCRFFYDNNRWHVEDLGSASGTFVLLSWYEIGENIAVPRRHDDSCKILHGQRMFIGGHTIKFQIE